MDKRANLLFWALLIGGGIIGDVISPTLYISREAGVAFGAILGLVIGLLVIPNFAQSLQRSWDAERRTAAQEGRALSLGGYWTHPTQLPMTLAAWWGVGLPVAFLTLRLSFQFWMFLVWLVPSFLGFGFSGLLMVLRKEFVKTGMTGQMVVRGGWAVFNGVLGMLFGFGGALAVLVAFFLDGK